MMRRRVRVYLDTSVIFAAVLSEGGGSRKIFRLGEAGVLNLVVGPNVLRECEEVVRRKVPASLPTLAYLLELGMVEIITRSSEDFIVQAKAIVTYVPDAHVLAEAMAAKPDWFVTHDKVHFLSANLEASLEFRLDTPGDIIRALEEDFTG